MKIGFGLYSHMLTNDYYKMAKQLGATHIVAHLTDYFHQSDTGADDQPLGNVHKGWGIAKEAQIWSYEELIALKRDIAKHGLILEALENFSPAFWYDILLDGPKRDEQLSNLKQLLKNMGKAGIPIMGYNFSLAGVAGRTIGPYARGEALSVGLEGYSEALDVPIPSGMIWNMIYDTDAPNENIETITHVELMKRYKHFINEMIPVAEEAGVKLAVHPDDPPLKEVRRQPRLGYHPDHYKEVMELDQSSSHVMELCLGTMAEMEDSNIYEALEYFAKNNKIGYIHFRNIKGKVPHYKEAFIDDGDIDMGKIIRILRKHKFEGVLIPDHAPQVTSKAPWDVGMAYAMGYIKALVDTIK
ncbi:mannonate dehydratase [Chitinophagaceae bacterium LB-8]|uniref:mannonate dehydratase n=1 Tax=Paraflavisolibacter caeni TaxID=2982496 RepID=A0A9X2XZE0_9BACT|nr:mannonate dehydratase [Paraflavisolibacter caeni]MCU7551507.1 mannonate dehydratase [Paraflavisolibacter caeni]